MTVEISSFDESAGLDRILLDLSSKCAEPICFASRLLGFRLFAPLDPTKFDHCESKITEIAYRTFILLSAAFAVLTIVIPVSLITLGIASKVLRAIGFAMQKNNYTHVLGSAPEKILENRAKLMTWNICGAGGGLSYNHGGVVDWRLRVDRIAAEILRADPDVLVLQEIYDGALAEALIERLTKEYAHFFIHLGKNVIGSVGGCMVLSKCAIHRFTNTSFSNNEWTLNRTYAALEIKARPDDLTPCARVIGTHLIDNDNSARRIQLNEILDSIANAPPLPTVLMGDLNLERDLPEEGGMLNPYFEHGYQQDEPTRTNKLLKQWDEKLVDPGDFIDYISLYRAHEPSVSLQNTSLVKAFDSDYNTQTALSDHNALTATLLTGAVKR